MKWPAVPPAMRTRPSSSSVAVWPTRVSRRCPASENDPVFGSNTTTESVGIPSTDPPAMSVRPSFNATAAAATRLSGVVPNEAHVPTACGSSARMLCVAAKTRAASTTPSTTRFLNGVLTQPPVPTQDTGPASRPARAHAGLEPLGYANGTKGNGYASMVQVASASSGNAEPRPCVKGRAPAAHQSSTRRKLYFRARSKVRGGVRSLVDSQIRITVLFTCSTPLRLRRSALAELRSEDRIAHPALREPQALRACRGANPMCDQSAASRENSSESQ